MPAVYLVEIIAKNPENQTVLLSFFSTHTGIHDLKMEPAAKQGKNQEEFFVPDKQDINHLLLFTDSNFNIIVRNSAFFEKGQTYRANISLAGVQSYFFSFCKFAAYPAIMDNT
jgi:hypothetical protein